MEQSKQKATIFNNVMGPVGIGPSTSNTCGPCRVAYLSAKLCRGPLKEAEIVFPAEGGYSSPNGKGMRSDYAFAHGLLGRLPDAGAPLLDAFDDLKAAGVELRFTVDPALEAGGEHLLSLLRLTDAGGETTVVRGLSKGGGIIELTQIDDLPVSIGGERHLLLVFTEAASAAGLTEALRSAWPELADYESVCSVAGGRALIQIPMREPFAPEKLGQVRSMDAVWRACVLPAILPVVVVPRPEPPFETADELSGYCERTGASLTEAAVAYERSVSGWSEERIRGYARSVLEAMRDAVRHGLEPGLRFDGIVEPSAARMLGGLEGGTVIDDGIVSRAAVYSLAVMEYSNASGVVVCMPTAGASGTVAGALLAAAERLGSTDRELVDALLAAGAVGVSISEDNDFCGGVYGCQAEVGCASGIAAAALAVLRGGTARQAMDAASMALQNMLGLICDPVCGLVQVPCFSRNMSAVANAVVCANAALLGYPGTIPLQDAFEAMKSSGASMPAELKGGGGGLCRTRQGRCLLERYTAGRGGT